MGAWLDTAVSVLLAEPAPALGPASRWGVAPAPAFDWRPSVLVAGLPLPPRDAALVRERGLLLHVASLTECLVRMAASRWDAVVVSPTVSEEADGLRFVRAFKCAAALAGAPSELEALRTIRYAATPFVVQPLEGDTQFAVFVSAERWFLEQTTVVSLGEAILRSIAAR